MMLLVAAGLKFFRDDFISPEFSNLLDECITEKLDLSTHTSMPPRVHDLLYRSYRPVATLSPPATADDKEGGGGGGGGGGASMSGVEHVPSLLEGVEVLSTTHVVVMSPTAAGAGGADGRHGRHSTNHHQHHSKSSTKAVISSEANKKQRVFFKHLCGGSNNTNTSSSDDGAGRTKQSLASSDLGKCATKLMTVKQSQQK
jgi:hypothetical protein